MPATSPPVSRKKRPTLQAIGRFIERNVAPVAGGLLGAQVGAPGAGASAAQKVAHNFGRGIAAALGLDPDGSASEAEVNKKLSDNPEAFALIKSAEAEVRIEELRLEASLADNDAAKLESVNETMRVEAMGTLTNPLSGKWRPLWGIVGLAVWGLLQVALSVAVFFVIRQELNVAVIGILVGALTTNMAGLYAILGVAVKGRSEEKTALAGALASLGGPRLPDLRATPIVPVDPADR